MTPVIMEWFNRWQIPPLARAELQHIFTGNVGVSLDQSACSEAAVLNAVRLEASRAHCRLWRNNVGGTYTPDGSFIRYGLANESVAVNRKIKSSDLIGIRPLLITAEHVGCIIGQFMSREIKSADWKYRNTEHEIAQLAWIQLITSLGGDACFATSIGTIDTQNNKKLLSPI